ncbi:MAG: CHAT domain-containing protein [Cyanobacteria bacterium P01_F01_bin.150]
MENSSSSAITTISSDAKTGATGSTGSISIDAAEIRLEGEVRIQVRNEVDETTAGNIRIIQSSDPLRRAASVQLLLGAQINSETEGRNATAGNVIIRATEVLLDDIGSLGDNPGGIDSTVQDGAINGRGGDVRINAQTLTNRGARIGTTVRGRGQGGTVILNVDDTILLTGNTESNDRADPQFGLGLIASAVRRPEDDVRLPDADPDNPDQGGDIVIRTGHLILENGAEIEAGAQRGGTGGEINIVADSVQLLRGETQGKVNRIVAQLEEEEGQGGGIEIVTDQLRVEEGSSISVATLAGGDSGDISIHADDIVVTGIFEKTGNPPPRRRENNGDDQPSSSSNPEDNLLRSEILANSDNRARGNAGTVDIETSTLEISDRARVSASVIESGETGNVNIRADNLTLDNGTISAEAVEGDDGNIKLIVQDRLLLLNGSSITATASETATGGRIIIDPVLVLLSDGSEITASNTSKEDTTEPINGGTIDLVTDFLVSVNAPNALTATAFEGDGGRINLTSISNYGDLNVDVSSVNGFDGEFNDNSLNLDPTQSLLELPSAFSDANNQVRNACAPGERGRGSFAVTGRSGLPSSPLSQTSSPILLPDLGPFGIMSTANNASTASIQTAQAEDVTARNTRLQEAQAWEIAANGTVTLSSTPEAESSIDDLLLQGRRAYNHADYQRAIALWTQAAEPLSDSSSANPDHSLVLASTLSNLALAYRQLGAWQQAEQAITASQSLFSVDQLSDPSAIAPVFAQALNTKAQLAFASGDIRGAIATWQQADAAYGQAQNPVGQIQTRLHLVQALNNLGLYDQAQEQLTGVTPVLEATTLSQETAIAHLNRGILLQQNGDLEEARQAFQESLTIAQSLDQATAKVTISSAILMNLGHLEYAQAQSPSLSRAMAYGKRGEALQYYQQAIATAAESGIESSALNTARLQAQLSTITLLQDQQRTEQRRNTQLMANSRTPLWQQQATRSAPSPFTRTDEASEAPSNLSATGSGNRTSQGQGVNWQSITALSLLTTAESLPASRDTLYTQLHLAHLFMEADQLEEEGLNITPNQIQTILQRVEQHARELGDRQALAYSLGYQGQLYAKAQQWDRTRTSTEQALYLSQQLLSPEMSYRWHWQLGQAYVAQGQKKKAIAVYTEAVKALKIVRADLASTRADVQFSFRDSVEPLYRQLVQLLLQPDDSSTVINHPSDSPTEHSADHPSKPSQANLKAARALIEDLQLAELQDYFKDACVTTTLEIDTVDPKAAVIYPIILNANLGGQTADQSGQRLDVILSMDGQPLDHYSTTIEDAGQVQQTVDDLLAALTTPFDSQLAQTTKNLQQVYNWILKPMDGSLKQLQPETLVFVADGPLRSLPFSALHDGQQYLVERYNVSISPGLRLFESQPLNNTEVSVFAGGISEARPGFTALPFVADEVQQIASQIPDNQILLNDQLTVANFAKGLADSPADVLHLATHGKFGADAASTFLLMWDQQLTIDEFSNLLQQRNQTALSPIDLLVLSACETAAGDSRAVLGIAGMAIKAGVRSAIAGLWPLNDQATSVFMEAFYQALAQPGTTKVEAFQQAQRVLMQDERFQAPYYWSPFVLVGNWQ